MKSGVWRRALSSVLFPAPEGAETTNRMPSRRNCRGFTPAMLCPLSAKLLNILNLFADLLHLRFARDHQLRDLHVVRLRPECVEFATDLLAHKLQRPSNRFVSPEVMG